MPREKTHFYTAILNFMRGHRLAIPLGIALIGLVLNSIVACRMAETTDEGPHVLYGQFILQGLPDRPSPGFSSKMPVSALNAIPRGVGKYLRMHGLAPGLAERLRDIRAARYATILAAFCLCLLVYLFAKSLFGRTAGLFAELIFIFSPNIIAHSTLATIDLYIALTAVLFLFCLRRFLLNPSLKNAVLTACALALAQLTKFTAVYLYIVLVIVIFPYIRHSLHGRKKEWSIPGRQIGVLLALSAVCFLVFINVGFLFDRTLTPLAQYQLKSTPLQALQRVPLLREIPLPVPYPYIQGFDWMSYDNANQLTFGNIVLLNEVRGKEVGRSDGFLSYYLVAYLLKEPLGMQVLLILGIIWVVRHRQIKDFLTGEWPLLVTAGVFLSMLSLFSNTQIGIRHILPVLAIFVILSGGAFASWLTYSRRQKVLLVGCLLYAVVSVASYFPHMIPYFNEILTDRKMAYRFLADSNLDWGQDRWIVESFLKSNPDVILDPPDPVAGRVLVKANLMAGVRKNKANYWLRQRMLKPVSHVGYAHLLFLVPPQ